MSRIPVFGGGECSGHREPDGGDCVTYSSVSGGGECSGHRGQNNLLR